MGIQILQDNVPPSGHLLFEFLRLHLAMSHWYNAKPFLFASTFRRMAAQMPKLQRPQRVAGFFLNMEGRPRPIQSFKTFAEDGGTSVPFRQLFTEDLYPMIANDGHTYNINIYIYTSILGKTKGGTCQENQKTIGSGCATLI